MMELRDITRRFGRMAVLHGISLTVPDGSFTSLLGPSGCGKSTTLRIMAGLDRPSTGQVLLDGTDVADRSAAERNVAMVFQSYALYPHLTVAENIALPLRMRQMSRFERFPGAARLLPSVRRKAQSQAETVRQVAETLGLDGLLDRKPSQLSGGQKQRAALGRAIVRDPSIFLLDEPLSNLDATLRVQMRAELTALHRRTGCPFVYVTHDQAEAMSLSDRVAVMMDGRIAQEGPPRALYERPDDARVAAFLGTHTINLLDVSLSNGRLDGPFAGLQTAAAAPDVPATIGIRPEDLWPDPMGVIESLLDRLEYLGNETLVHALLPDGRPIRALAAGGFVAPAPGEPLRLSVRPDRVHLFDRATGQRLPSLAGSVAA
ncbi:MAG: ABC transporter ATP-binding protein [Pikeienuella sp.]